MYATLAEARKWEKWLGIAQLVHTAQSEDLQPGNTFCYTSNLAPGFVDAVVQDAEPGKVHSSSKYSHACDNVFLILIH